MGAAKHARSKEKPGARPPARPGPERRERAATPATPRAPETAGAAAAEPLEVLYGLRSALAVFAQRRQDIRAVSYAPALRPELRELLAWSDASGVRASEAHEKQLAQLADSTQHEGIVLGVKPRRWLAAKELPGWLVANQKNAVALDRVRNPQNIGAILRSAAFFGFGSAILGAPAPHPGLPPFAIRIAEGGAEHLELTRTTDLADSLARLRASGVRVIGTDIDAPVEVRDAPPLRPIVVVVGNEREGLGPRIRAQCDLLVAIRGCGAVQSLNVAVAAGVAFAALTRVENVSA